MTGGLANNRQILKNYLLCCLELLRWLIDVIRTCVPDSFWWHQHCWWFGVSSCSWCQRALLALSGSSSDGGYRPGRDGVWRGECSIEIRTPLEFLLLPSHPGAIKVVQLLGAWHLLSVAISKLTRVLGLFFFVRVQRSLSLRPASCIGTSSTLEPWCWTLGFGYFSSSPLFPPSLLSFLSLRQGLTM